MMTPRRHLALALAVLLAQVCSAVAGPPGVDRLIVDRIIVHIAAGSDLDTFITAFEANHRDPEVNIDPAVQEQIPGRPIFLLGLEFPGGYTDALLAAIECDLRTNYPGILHVGDLCDQRECDACLSADFLYENETAEGKTGSAYLSGIAPAAFGEQYAIPLMGIEDAPARSTGLGTVIALLDTGIDATHPRLTGRVLPFGYNFVDDNDDVSETENGVDEDKDGDTDEMTGHGTFVAGLLMLVAPDARILPVKVLNDDGVGHEWTLVKGLYYAIDRGVEVINLSLGSTYDTMAVKEAVAEAAKHGIIIVAAAGNLNRDDPEEHPAADDAWIPDPPQEIIGALGVAATDHADIKADFSNFGKKLVLSAPADMTGPFDPDRAIVSILPNDDYGAWKGTSFATAFVSGTAALVRAQHPQWAADVQTYQDVAAVLTGSSVDIYDLNPDFAKDRELGEGRLDVAAAVAKGPVAPAVLGDLDNDGFVRFDDLLVLLADWDETHSSADLDGDGRVSFDDLLILLTNWG